MPLTELLLLLPAEFLDAWSDAMLEAGAVSVSIEDADSGTAGESPRYGEPGFTPVDISWNSNRVSVLVDSAIDAQELVAAAAQAVSCPAPRILSTRLVEEQDWVELTQAQFAPVQVGRIWVVPTWHEPPDPKACVLRLDPGAAFGTGTHPTTRLCMAWIDANLRPGQSVLDYGCGSGILSICAALLGAGNVVGVDIDEQAVTTARSNAQRNGARADYTTPDLLAADVTRQFDLVVANILANPIALLAPALVRRVGRGGSIVLSGILDRQADEVIEAYRVADPNLHLRVHGREDSWVAIAGGRAN
jgi:ribosomal protein L11 methyltransferase